jgi:hypothetical protein
MNHNRRTFIRNAALAGSALALPRSIAGQTAPSGGSQEPLGGSLIREKFETPSKKFRPMVRWWWPGDDVNEEELRREIGALDQAGIGGAEIQAFFKGLDPNAISQAQMREIGGFATPSFFRHVGVAADEARKRGMFIDYTFGSGWPFGGGEAITPELASIELRFTHLSVVGQAKLNLQLQIPSLTDGDPSHGSGILNGLPDGWADRMKKRTKLVAVVAVRGEDAQWDFHADGGPRQRVRRSGRLEGGTAVDLTAQLAPDGTLHWGVPPGTWQLFVFCSLPTGQRVNGAIGGPKLVMDHLSAEAFRAHARRVGDDAIPFIGEYFGDGLRAIFCDSLEVAANLFWSDDFLAEFRRRRGYDLTPYLPVLKVQTTNEPFGEYVDLPIFDMTGIGDQVRHDYRQTVSDLMAERFYGEFNKWARAHKLLSRTQAHGAPADVLKIYGEANIPETEDLYDEGGYDFLKMAASAAHVYGRAIVGSESFVWPNALYQTTPEKMKLAADELLTAGVNAIVYHGFPYVVPEIPPPGWHPFSGINGAGNYSSQLNELNPFWPYLAQLNGYFARLQFLSQTGKNVAAVALYRNDLAHGAEEMPPTPKLNQALMDTGYNYDHINAESLLRCTVREKYLKTLGGASYKALVLPALEAIDATLAEKLVDFAREGLPVLFAGQTPSQADGFLDDERNTGRVRAAMQAIRKWPNVSLAADIVGMISSLTRVASPNVKFHGRPLPFIQKQIGAIDAFFLRNPSDSVHELYAEFEAEGAPELWDAWTGKTSALSGYQRRGQRVEVHHDLNPFASALIVFDPDAPPQPPRITPAAPTVRHAQPIGAAGWKLAARGLVPSGKTAEIHRDLAALIDFSLDDELRGFSGRSVYTTTFAAPSADSGVRLVLDLGDVRDVAEVAVNGRPAGALLLRPYQIDITGLVQQGENDLEVSVTNSLFNSMVLRDPRTFRAGPAENPSGLMSAGLIGPVQLKIVG